MGHKDASIVKAAFNCWYNAGAKDDGELFAEYLPRVAGIAPLNGSGAIVFVRDPNDPRIFWVDVYSNRFYIGKRRANALIAWCRNSGAKWIAANTRRAPALRRLWKRLGFQDIGDGIMSAKVVG